MFNRITIGLGAAMLTLAACTEVNQDQAAGAAVGGVLGAITAAALGADDEWLIIGTLVGAGAGALVAPNQQTGECAYSAGHGGYYTAPCP